MFRIITRASERELDRSGAILPRKTDFERRWVEPAFRLIGVGVAKAMEMVPARWALAVHDRSYARLAAPRSYTFDDAAPVLRRGRALAARARESGGREPALLTLISHPPAMGDLAHLNFELVRHATRALAALRGRPCRPRLVVATDPFALDGTSTAGEGLYAGYMGTYHIGVDRLALGRGAAPGMTPRASWAAMPMRLFRVLREGGEVGLVLSGGVPETGRVLYGAREWVGEVRARSPRRGRSADVARALDGDAVFARFARSAPDLLPPPSRTWRRIEAWLMAAAAGLPPGQDVREVAQAVLSCLAVPPAERPLLLSALDRDLARETPRRARLFRALAGRVVGRRPLVMIPIMHRIDPLGIALGEARSWEAAGPGRVLARRADAPEAGVETTPEAFAERFVAENFR